MKILKKTNLLFGVAIGLALGVLVSLSPTLFAEADGDPSTDNLSRVIPYEGALELDGVAVNGLVGMRFVLSDDAGNPLWLEEWSDDSGTASCAPAISDCRVAVYNGRFSVLLGQHVPLEDVVLDAEDLFVTIAIRLEGEDWTQLAGRQQITAAPYALWSAQGSDFHVAGDLTVDRHARVGQWLFVEGSNLSLGLNDGRDAGGATLQRALVHEESDQLIVNYDSDFEGGVQLNGGVDVGVGVGAAPTTASLTLPNSAGGAPWFDAFADFQLLLWNGTDPLQSNGIGTNASTLAFNSAVSHIFNIAGSLVATLDNAMLTVEGGLHTVADSSFVNGLDVHGELRAAAVHDNCGWTGYFSEEDPAKICAAGYFISGIQCDGSNCDNLRLRCCRPFAVPD